MKKIIFIIPSLLLISCSSNSFKYINKNNIIKKDGAKYFISKTNVKFKTIDRTRVTRKTPEQDNFPNEKEISILVKKIFIENLKKQNLYSENKKDKNRYKLNMQFDYQRVSLFYNKNSFSFPILKSTINIYNKKNDLIATSELNKYTTTNSCNRVYRLLTLGICDTVKVFRDLYKVLFDLKTPLDEEKAFMIITKIFVDEINSLSK